MWFFVDTFTVKNKFLWICGFIVLKSENGTRSDLNPCLEEKMRWNEIESWIWKVDFDWFVYNKEEFLWINAIKSKNGTKFQWIVNWKKDSFESDEEVNLKIVFLLISLLWRTKFFEFRESSFWKMTKA